MLIHTCVLATLLQATRLHPHAQITTNRFPKLHIEPFKQFEGSITFTNFIEPLLPKNELNNPALNMPEVVRSLIHTCALATLLQATRLYPHARIVTNCAAWGVGADVSVPSSCCSGSCTRGRQQVCLARGGGG